MRNLLAFTTGLLLATTACESAPPELKEPPVLKVTSPQRSLVQAGAGSVTVTGTVTPNSHGVVVEKVLVNNVQAILAANGAFQATIDVQPGAMLIHTVARDAEGGEASDTRAVHAGELRPAGANIERAVTAAISTDAFAKIASAAGPLIEGMDLGAMLAPMNPMIHGGDEDGPDCLYGRVTIDDVKFSKVAITLVPKAGGITFRAQITGLDVPGRATYAVSCADGSNNLRVKATTVVVGGTLLVSPNGTAGFKTDLASPDVQITGLDIQASGIPNQIIDLLHIETAIQAVISKGAEAAMKSMMNKALGALGGPQSIDALGHTIDVQVAPAAITFDVDGAIVVLNMKMLIQGAESGKGFIYTDNGMPVLDAGDGFQLGLADDLANSVLAAARTIGLLDLSLPADAGSFDTAELKMTLPPMISADPVDGKMRVVLGDMVATFTNDGLPVATAAINARIDLAITSAANGYGVALELGKPEIQVNVLGDIDNDSGLTDTDLARTIEFCLDAQLASVSKLLTSIPLPVVAGLQMRNLSVGSDDGYLMVTGALE